MTEKQFLTIIEKARKYGFKTALQECELDSSSLLHFLSYTNQLCQISLEEKKEILQLIESELLFFKLQDKKLGVLSDTHIGSVNENFTYLNMAYESFAKAKIHNVIHLGNLVEGYAIEKQKSSTKEDLEKGKLACIQQIEKVGNYYPKNFQNYVMWGNHERSFSLFHVDLVRELTQLRKDFSFFQNQIVGFDWNGRKIKLTHKLLKESPEWLNYFFMSLGGHHHFYHYNANYHTLKVPTCSNNFSNQGSLSKSCPGFLILENKENGIVVHRYGFDGNETKHILKRVIK